MVAEAIIRKTCKELDIEIVDMAVNPDHVHIFLKYLLKYSVSYISKMIKGGSSRILRKSFPQLKELCGYPEHKFRCPDFAKHSGVVDCGMDVHCSD